MNPEELKKGEAGVRLLKRFSFAIFTAILFLYLWEDLGFLKEIFAMESFVKSTAAVFVGLGIGWRFSR